METLQKSITFANDNLSNIYKEIKEIKNLIMVKKQKQKTTSPIKPNNKPHQNNSQSVCSGSGSQQPVEPMANVEILVECRDDVESQTPLDIDINLSPLLSPVEETMPILFEDQILHDNNNENDISIFSDNQNNENENLQIEDESPLPPAKKRRTANRAQTFIKKELERVFTETDLACHRYTYQSRKSNKDGQRKIYQPLSPTRVSRIEQRASKAHPHDYEKLKQQKGGVAETFNSKCRKVEKKINNDNE
eukprot:TCONS_00063981-protein